MFGVPGSKWRCVVFRDDWNSGFAKFGGRTNTQVFIDPTRMDPGQVWMLDNF